MKALTIIQPYAELIARGEKRVENRTWYSSFRGMLAIHAGKSRKYGCDSVEEICEWYSLDPSQIKFGAIIAVARMVDCVSPEKGMAKYPWMVGNEHVNGPYCFVLENVQRIPPVAMNGAQGFWDAEDALIQSLTPERP